MASVGAGAAAKAADVQWDVLVVGGGPAGVAAGFAAARMGCRALIVEQCNCLGGIATAGGHGHLCLYSSFGNPQWGTDELVVGGIPLEIARRTAEEGFGTFDGRNCEFEVEGMKYLLDRMAAESGAEVLFHTFCDEVVVADGAVTGVRVANKGGRATLRARRIVDCTGDGDVAAAAGVPFEVGDAQGRCQPATLMFQLGGVDMDRVRAFQMSQPNNDWKLANVWQRAQAAGDMRPFQSVIMGWWWTPTRPDELGINFTHVTGVDATSAESVTAATQEARRQVFESITVFRKYVPGMERVRLLWTAPLLGVRESRRIQCAYCLTKADLLAEKEFPDAIGYGSFFIDIHNVAGPGMDPRSIRPRNGFKYQIPYRILVPQGVQNLLVAGRCASATHEALGSLRVMPQCGIMGQAAGVAAALSLRAGQPPGEVDVNALQTALREQGGIVTAADIVAYGDLDQPVLRCRGGCPR